MKNRNNQLAEEIKEIKYATRVKKTKKKNISVKKFKNKIIFHHCKKYIKSIILF